MVTKEGKLYTVSKKDTGILQPNIEGNDYDRLQQPIDAVFQSSLGEINKIYDIIFTSDG